MMPLTKSQNGRFAALLKFMTGAKGAGMLDVLQLVSPSIELTTDRPDLLAFKGEFLYSTLSTGTAAAAQFPTVWLGTRDTAIMVVEQIILQSATAQKVRAKMVTTAMPGAPANVEFDDKRVLGGRFSGLHVFSSEAALTANPNRFQVSLTANVPLILPVKYIVTGQRVDGTAANLQIQGETALTDLVVMSRGYGRTLEQSEVQP